MGLWTSTEFRTGKTAYDGGSNPPGTILRRTEEERIVPRIRGPEDERMRVLAVRIRPGLLPCNFEFDLGFPDA